MRTRLSLIRFSLLGFVACLLAEMSFELPIKRGWVRPQVWLSECLPT